MSILRRLHRPWSVAPLPPPAAGTGGPVLVLAGRPNVGKSTIFNRILGERRAVVEATPGVTRDRNYARAEWAGRSFVAVDTGGLGGAPGDPFAGEVAVSSRAALAQADVVLFIVDAGEGLVPADADIAAELRRLRRPVVLVANKADRHGAAVEEFFALGLGEPWPVSAIRGEGLGDVLDRALELARGGVEPAHEGEEAPPSVAFVGRPNVGKSSLVNRLLGDARMIVSEIAGTTRDAIDVLWEVDGRQFVLVDTPGLRRPGRVARQGVERWSGTRTAAAIARCEVAVVVLDASEPATDQDKRIAGRVADRRRAAVVLLNKVDLLTPAARAAAVAEVRRELPFLSYAPVLACSAKSGDGLAELPATLRAVGEAYRRRLGTSPLNQCIRTAVALHPPASFEGRPVRIYYAAQIRSAPPTVALVINHRGGVSNAYARYLENRLREQFDLPGSPVRFVFRERAHRALVVGANRARPQA